MSVERSSAGPLTVFISSTYLDNADRRRRVEEAVLHAGMGRFARGRRGLSLALMSKRWVRLIGAAPLLEWPSFFRGR